MKLGQLLKGKEAYVTTCERCKQRSASEVPFHELELSIEGLGTVAEALERYFSIERLCSENQNQYFCSYCNSHQDAERHTEILETPPVLFIQLLRYIYDRNTFEKLKLKDLVSFQPTLAIRGESFKLVALLYHIGHSAYGGHYVADVLEWDSGLWWHCDDDSTSSIADPAGPAPHPGGPTKDVQVVDISEKDGEASTSQAGRKRKRAGADATSSGTSGRISSRLNRQRDVYMLAYVKESSFNESKSSQHLCPSPEIVARVDAANCSFAEEVAAYNVQRDNLAKRIFRRKQTYEEVSAGITPSPSGSEPYNLVPTKWLRQWITGLPNAVDCHKRDQDSQDEQNAAVSIGNSSRAAIHITDDNVGESSERPTGYAKSEDHSAIRNQDNSMHPIFSDRPSFCSVMCSHGHLNPAAVRDVKVVSRRAYQNMLCSLCEGDDAISEQNELELCNSNYRCEDCFNSTVATRSQQSDHLSSIDSVLEAIAAADNIQGGARGSDVIATATTTSSGSCWISKKWLQRFNRYATSLKKDLESAQGASSSKQGGQTRGLDKYLVTKTITNDGKKTAELLGSLDAINSDLLCHHQKPLPLFQKLAKPYPEAIWERLIPLLDGVNKIPPVHLSVAEAVPCSACSSVHDNAIEDLERKKAFRSSQMGSKHIQALFNRKHIYPPEFGDKSRLLAPLDWSEEGERFYLVSAAWLADWRAHLQNLKEPSPGPLTNAAFRCRAHGQPLIPDILRQLGSPGAEYVLREGADKIVNRNVDPIGDGFPAGEIVTQEQWLQLIGHYGAPSLPPASSASASSPSSPSSSSTNGHANVQDEVDKSSSEVIVIESSQEDGTSNRNGSHLESIASACDNKTSVEAGESIYEVCVSHAEGQWSWSPAPCADCVAEIKKRMQTARSNFENCTVKVLVVEDKTEEEILASSLLCDEDEGAAGAGAGMHMHGMDVNSALGKRRVRSTRKASKKQLYDLYTSSTDTIGIVKLKIFQDLLEDAFPSRQMLFYKGKKLTELQRTLADCKVAAGDTLLLALAGERGEDSGGGFECWGEYFSAKSEEVGFAGTFLTGSLAGASAGKTNASSSSSSSARGEVTHMASAPSAIRISSRGSMGSMGERDQGGNGGNGALLVDAEGMEAPALTVFGGKHSDGDRHDEHWQPSGSSSGKNRSDVLEQLQSMGFALQAARPALDEADGDIDRALHILLSQD
jgi:hypothetical protein